jgi:UDP-N-acetyl-D-glucosamine dehydrogenase
MNVAVVGQGYVGLPLAIAAANAGHEVVGVDINDALVARLSVGESPIGDIASSSITAVLGSSYSVTTDFGVIRDCSVVVVCVPTPLDEARNPDLVPLTSALESVALHLAAGTLVIVESTVSPGSTRKLAAPILDKAGVVYELAYSPERIDPANKNWNVTNTPKLVAGITESARDKAVAFYSSFVSQVHTASSVEAIETAKLLENSFRLVNISFINEIAAFCAKLGIDVREVIGAAATKPYGFMPFYPGAGVGGHCIPVDPSYLLATAKEVGAPMRFIELANEVNLSLPSYFVGVAQGMLGSLSGRKVLVVGIAYKPDVSDLRESPALPLISLLRGAGAEVSWHDDLVGSWNGESSVALTSGYDLAILVNPHTGVDLGLLGDTKVLNARGAHA